MKKPYILLVEDEAILYERLRKKLIQASYEVSDYLPSVSDALDTIRNKKPDLALLDINLQGEATGLDLGKILHNEYGVPVIYVTERQDEESFYAGLYGSDHQDYVIKTHGKLDIASLLRKIKTFLHHNKPEIISSEKLGLVVYTDYLKELKELGREKIGECVVAYQDIAFITTNSEVVVTENKQTGRIDYEKMRVNNARVATFGGDSFVVPNNLATIIKVLPIYFVRISEDYIVNIHHSHFDGRINGRRLKIGNQIFHISEGSYKKKFEERYKMLYQSLKRGDFQ